MPLFMFKSILAVVFFAASLVAVFSMLTMMGKSEKKVSPKTLKAVHKTAGFIFFALLLVLSYICLKYWIQAGDQVSSRASLHSVLSFGLLAVFLVKIFIAQFYKQLLRLMPALGITVFCLAFVVTGISAGYYMLRTWTATPAAPASSTDEAILVSAGSGSVETGREIFTNKCGMCHMADSEESKAGPGLKNLLKKDILPTSQRPASLENVKEQIIRPFLGMPSFPELGEKEMSDLLAYIATL